jgi:ElaB/YqjD/DUF883 family membrane-anchored ribosome-binding protein
MSDDELLAIYGATRKLAESMEARDAELKQSTAALEAAIVQVRQLPALLGAQTSKYIAAGIREVVKDDFKQPIEKAVEGPVRSVEVAAYHAREVLEQLKQHVRYLNWTWLGIALAIGMMVGTIGTYFFFAHEVTKLNDRFDYLQHLLLAPPPAAVDTHVPPPKQAGKKPGPH